MTEPTPPPAPKTKPWYASKTVWGAAATLMAVGLSAAGIEYAVEDQQATVEAILQIVAAAGGLLAIYGRTVADSDLTL